MGTVCDVGCRIIVQTVSCALTREPDSKSNVDLILTGVLSFPADALVQSHGFACLDRTLQVAATASEQTRRTLVGHVLRAGGLDAAVAAVATHTRHDNRMTAAISFIRRCLEYEGWNCGAASTGAAAPVLRPRLRHVLTAYAEFHPSQKAEVMTILKLLN